jgi:cysteinyl-tRNA synthetase
LITCIFKFFESLSKVNIEKPDILSRVTEYIPEILDFVNKIYENGYAFEKDGSVYFDGIKYRHDKNIETKSNDETELKTESHNPSSKHNFVLLKKAKSYEPGWDSKWGRVRPGWHIECSAMASSVFGNTLDIHGGGIDLAFPHHHNEVFQSDARFYPNENKTWVQHFMHTGHLNIKGLKMSRSLKNFITIKEILRDYTSNQLRMLFLLHLWSTPMDYSSETMKHAVYYVDLFKNFETQIRTIKLKKNNLIYKKYGNAELELSEHIVKTNKMIDDSIRDNLNTPDVISHLQNLISKIYQYVENVETDKKDGSVCSQLIDIGYKKVVETLNMFGLTLFESNNISGLEDKLIKVVYDIRSDIRTLAKGVSGKSTKEVANSLFNLTDDIRDNKMKSIGIDLVDKKFD